MQRFLRVISQLK